MRPRWGRKASAWLLVSLSIVGMGMLVGCEKAGGNDNAAVTFGGTVD